MSGATPDPSEPARDPDAVSRLKLTQALQRAKYAIAWERSWPHLARLCTVVGLFLVAYGLGRFALGVVRLDPAFLLGLQIEQLLALAMAAAGVVYGIRPLLAKAGDRARALQPRHEATRTSPQVSSPVAD